MILGDTGAGPTFLIIGAAKSGTTSLYQYLRTHPDVFVTPVKEPRFFALEGMDPARLGRLPHPVTTDWVSYLALFDGARPGQARGEASVTYLNTSGVIEAVQRRVPDVRLLAILRHPVEAAWSSYLMTRRNQGITMSFDEVIDAEPDGPRTALPPAPGSTDRHVRARYYHAHLSRWFAAFGREQLQVYLYDDLRSDPTALLRSVCTHIGVDPDVELDLSRRHNVGTDPRSTRLHRLLHRPGPRLLAFKRSVRTLPGVRRFRARVDGLNRRDPAAIPECTRHRLLELYREDTVALEGLLERDLSAWRR